jgi:ribosomal protein S18 acetylase RimI-like enzyme
MPVNVRPAVPSDAPVIAEFNRRLALETEALALEPAVLAAGVAAILRDAGRGLYFVGEADGEVVGQLMITYEWSDWRNGWIWWLQSVYVHADFRGRGVFKTIFEYAREQARQAGNVAAIRLYVENENRNAQRTYEKLGFTEMHFRLYQKTPV